MKNIFKCFFLFFILNHSAMALLSLDIVMVHKKGIDKELTLVSEIQSKERVFGREKIILKMKNNVSLELSAYFVSEEGYGPSGQVLLDGQVVNLSDNSRFYLSEQDSLLRLNEEREFIYKNKEEDQIVELRVRPYLE